MGKQDIIKHCNMKNHVAMSKALANQQKLSFHTPERSEELKRTEAELQMAVLTASSNVPLAFHDNLSPVFPDSKIASKYRSASTKATCMLNEAVAPMLIEDLLQSMKLHPFSLSVDGSNDEGLEKMNPLTVRIFYINANRIVTRFLDMCTSSSATAEGIFTVIDEKLTKFLECAQPWNLCTSVGVDNTSVNIGIRNSLKTRVLTRNPAIYFNGCPCHIIHNAAQKAAESFMECCGFDVEEFTIDLFYWFDKSTKRKNGLRDYCTFCDHKYRAVVKHVSTRWLSLELAVQRSLKQFPGLTSYFKSENEQQARFKRLQKAFNDPMTEVYLLFFQSIMPSFTHCNQFLQQEEPLIHVLQPQLERMLRNILAKFVKASVIAEHLRAGTLTSIDFKNDENHVGNNCLSVGFLTKQSLDKLLREGDISPHQYAKFFMATKAFLIRASEYLLKWCPLEDELLMHATWIDFQHRLEKSFMSVGYFVAKYPEIFPDMDLESLNEQFLNYQLLLEEDIPAEVKEVAKCAEDDPHYRVDILWGYLKGVKKPGTNSLEFDLLFRVAEVVMTIPHSNAGEERIFSLINKNKTPSRSSLSLMSHFPL
ncbi:PREDICTED: uncharacterized protein LOC107326933 [Paramuricea clavata]|uniref:PREDICTED: uncharacterized protein LOC107326933 n=1 Tax=Paramuricea clavata TaxID=317549 RepID=A0A7D9LQS6_PARCT|nr:PREDICTED: uncharacterized protein LOC107326933 [Paramuricea clavata]